MSKIDDVLERRSQQILLTIVPRRKRSVKSACREEWTSAMIAGCE